MGTRSNIGYENEDGSVRGIYCHWDGYPSNNGVILRDHYKTLDRVKALVALGSLSSLAPSIEKPDEHSFNSPVDGHCAFYGRDRGEQDTGPETCPSVTRFVQCGEEYIYIFTVNHGWVCSDHGEEPIPLAAAIASDS